MPNSFSVEATANVRIEFSVGEVEQLVQNITQEAATTNEIKTTTTTAEKQMPQVIANSNNDDQPPPSLPIDNSLLVSDEKKVITQKPLTLPDAISKKDATSCQRYLNKLTTEQGKNVIKAFNHAMKNSQIKSATRYFIGLTRKAQKGELTVPLEAFIEAKPSAEKIAAAEEKERRHDLWSQFTWLEENAVRNNVGMQTLAEQMGLQEAYALYNPMENLSTPA
jgi:hypothetical protein